MMFAGLCKKVPTGIAKPMYKPCLRMTPMKTLSFSRYTDNHSLLTSNNSVTTFFKPAQMWQTANLISHRKKKPREHGKYKLKTKKAAAKRLFADKSTGLVWAWPRGKGGKPEKLQNTTLLKTVKKYALFSWKTGFPAVSPPSQKTITLAGVKRGEKRNAKKQRNADAFNMEATKYYRNSLRSYYDFPKDIPKSFKPSIYNPPEIVVKIKSKKDTKKPAANQPPSKATKQDNKPKQDAKPKTQKPAASV